MREIRFIDHTQPKVLKKALDLVRDVFWEFDASYYSDEGILEFTDYIELDHIQSLMEKEQLVMLGCYENRRLAGVIALRVPGHISLLFVAKDFQRRGIARTMVEAVIRCVRQLSDVSEITVNASPYAAAVYQKLGFVPTDNEQSLNGIRFVPMTRSLL